jgi:hypothetical protein
MYSITVLHEGLNKFQVVRGHSPWEAQQKAASKKAAWDHQYARLQARESKRQTYEGKRTQREALKEEAAERTAEAEQLIEELRSVLVSIVEASPVFVIANQKIVTPFDESEPKSPNYHDYPLEPKREDWNSAPEFNVLDRLFAFRKSKTIRISREKDQTDFLKAYAQWSETCAKRQHANKELHKDYIASVAKWHHQKISWEENRDKINQEIDSNVVGLRTGDADSVYWLFENVWNCLQLPEDLLSGEYQIHFDETAKTLVVDLDLPEFEKTPNIKGVRYVASRNETEEVLHKESSVRALYDEFVYQLALGIPHPRKVSEDNDLVQRQREYRVRRVIPDVGVFDAAAPLRPRTAATVVHGNRVIGDDEFRRGVARICDLPDTFRPDRRVDISQIQHERQNAVPVLGFGLVRKPRETFRRPELLRAHKLHEILKRRSICGRMREFTEIPNRSAAPIVDQAEKHPLYVAKFLDAKLPGIKIVLRETVVEAKPAKRFARLYEPIGRSERAGHEVKAIKLIVLLIRRQKSPLVPDRYIMVVLVP